MTQDKIVVGSKVKLQKDCYFCGMPHNPKAGAVGEVYRIEPSGFIRVLWFSGTYNGRALEKKDNLKNCYKVNHLKLIP